MKKIAMIVRAWVSVRWFALRHAETIETQVTTYETIIEAKDKRIQLFLQQIEARDKALDRTARRIDELEKQLQDTMDKAIAAGTDADMQKAEVQRLAKQLQELETKGEAEYAVMPTTNGTAKRTRRKKAGTPE